SRKINFLAPSRDLYVSRQRACSGAPSRPNAKGVWRGGKMQSKRPARAVLTMKRQRDSGRRLHTRYPLNPGLPNVAVVLQGLHNEGHELLRSQIQNLST